MKGIFSYDSPIVRAMTKIGDCICLSVLWLVFSLPVITMGAASTALYSAVYRCLRKEEAGIWRSFWGAFRENFKRSTLLWLVELLILAVLTADVFVFRSLKIAGDFMGNFYLPALILWCLALTWTVYLSAYAAKFEGGVREVLRLSFLLLMIHPIKALGVILPILGGVALILLVPFMALILPTVIVWISSFTLEKVFLLHMSPEDAARAAEDLTDPSEREEGLNDQ